MRLSQEASLSGWETSAFDARAKCVFKFHASPLATNATAGTLSTPNYCAVRPAGERNTVMCRVACVGTIS
jgi:hypothetical protein